MHELLASYLFQYKKCPFPGVGHLVLNRESAQIITGSQIIRGPRELIVFSRAEISSADLAEFISTQKEISVAEADYLLQRTCAAINSLADAASFELPGAGKFVKNEDGDLLFLSEAHGTDVWPDLPAVKLIKTDEQHNILVGDTETTNHAMSEFFADKPVKARRGWIITAIVMFVLALAVIIYYFNDRNGTGSFGNAAPVSADTVPSQYRTAP